MLAPSLISAETGDALEDFQVLALTNLVKGYRAYRDAYGKWPKLATKLELERLTPTVKTKALKAILTLLEDIPSVVVESQGDEKSPTFYSTPSNLDALAQEVLNTLYDVPMILGRTGYILVQRRVQDLTLNDNAVLRITETGRRY